VHTVRRLAKHRSTSLTIVSLRRSQSDGQGATVPIRKGCRKGNGKKETENGKGKNRKPNLSRKKGKRKKRKLIRTY